MNENVRRSLSLASDARKLIVSLAFKAQASHVASALSVVDILAAIYSNIEIITHRWKSWSGENIVILSKGHASMAMYAVLNLVGILPSKNLHDFGENGSTLGGHVTHGVPGIEFSSGSLGHGLPVGVGIALLRKRLNREGHVFVVMSDGELDEGTTWESLLLGSHHSLNNLTVLIDRNRLQSLANTEETLALEPLEEKIRSFGWDVAVVHDHNHESLCQFLNARLMAKRPQVAICENTKGRGVGFMEHEVVWHYRPPNESEYAEALKELGCE